MPQRRRCPFDDRLSAGDVPVPVRVGKSEQPLRGSLDDIRIYERALTAAEIASIHGANGG